MNAANIRAAIEAEFNRSPAPPTTDDIAAAVLRAAVDQVEPTWDNVDCINHLKALVAELENGTSTSSTHLEIGDEQ